MQGKTDFSANYPRQKYTIIGAGIISYIAAYYLWEQAQQAGTPIRISMQEKNHSLADTTASNISPSLTIDEIMSVVPPSPELLDKLKRLFNETGGIRVDDVLGVNDSKVYQEFLNAVEKCGLNIQEHMKRTEALYGLGVMSMNAWQQMYDHADAQLKAILLQSNFQPCREPRNSGAPELHDGYRIDLIYNVAPAGETNNALKKAQTMSAEYQRLGYEHCEVLSPDEVMRRDPHLAEFCKQQSYLDTAGIRVWNNTASAVWRPGGCIDTRVFLPLFHDYLTQKMGTYTNAEGIIKNNFRVHYDRKVEGLSAIETDTKEKTITGLQFFGQTQVKKNKHHYNQSEYLFCTGEKVGTLKQLGLPEPEYTRFAGPSLRLVLEIPLEQLEALANYNHCMEVHQEGVVLAWQGRVMDGKLSISVAGTKAFYGDQEPKITQAFAKDRNLLQFNMINDVLPQFISQALGRNTQGQKLTSDDLQVLLDKGIAKCWVGSRAVAYDGFPTIGKVAKNGTTITHAGSGGVSFSHALVKTLFNLVDKKDEKLVQDTLQFADPNRTFRVNL